MWFLTVDGWRTKRDETDWIGREFTQVDEPPYRNSTNVIFELEAYPEPKALSSKDYCAKNDITNYELFTDEGISGTKSSRPALDRMIAAVNHREISSVVVYSFSRFARSTTHLLNALQIFKSKNVAFVSLTEKIDTSTPVGVAVFSILAAISQLERDLVAERVKAGLANARAKGRLIGRKKMRDSDLIRKLLKAGMTFRQIVADRSLQPRECLGRKIGDDEGRC